MALKKHGITTETIKHMILNAGVIYKNLKYDSETSAWTGTVLGATSGGITFHYEATWLDVEVDGATVTVKEITKQKVGESAYIQGSMTEFTPDILISALHLVEDATNASEDANYTKYITKSNIDESDYIDNVAYVGTMTSGQPIIVILPNALCTEAFEINPQNSTQTTFTIRFDCTADLANDTLDKLDLEIYYPVTTA